MEIKIRSTHELAMFIDKFIFLDKEHTIDYMDNDTKIHKLELYLDKFVSIHGT